MTTPLNLRLRLRVAAIAGGLGLAAAAACANPAAGPSSGATDPLSATYDSALGIDIDALTIDFDYEGILTSGDDERQFHLF